MCFYEDCVFKVVIYIFYDCKLVEVFWVIGDKNFGFDKGYFVLIWDWFDEVCKGGRKEEFVEFLINFWVIWNL